MHETTSVTATETETDTETCEECGCSAEDTEGGCTTPERGCTIGGGSPELLGVLLVLAVGRKRVRKSVFDLGKEGAP